MRALDRKLLRDIWAIKGQALAICLVMGSGVATFIMALSVASSLKQTQHRYYERFRFAEVFASLKRAPNYLRSQLADIPGVARAQTRVVVDVTLDIAGMSEPAVGRLTSVPETRRPALNDFYLREGRYIAAGRRGEVVVSEPFAQAHGYAPGDTVTAVINGSKKQLKIVGIALSPEYVYGLRPGELIPDDKRFGVFWMSYEELAPAYDMEGAFNNVAIDLAPNASKAEVIQRVDRLLAPYGGLGAYGREDQSSHKFVANEMRQLNTMAFVTPSIFLFVSAFLLNVVLSRQVQTQREQIAALKAFGYSQLEVGLHYFKFVLALVLVGMCLGLAAGTVLGRWMTYMYTGFFHFPEFSFSLDPGVVLLAATITGGASLAGTLGAVARAMKLPPAEAMRPEPPARFRATIVERMGLGGILSQPARMILRQLERRPVKSGLSVLGIALAVSVLILGNFVVDAVDYLLQFQFFQTQRQDMTVSFVEPVSPRALHEIEHMPGVIQVEPFRSVPVRVRYGHRTRRLGIMGLPSERRLFRLMDANEKTVDIPAKGLVVSQTMGQALGFRRGDKLRVEVLEGDRPVRDVTVSAFLNDYSDLSAYMNRKALHRLMKEGESYSGAFLLVDANAVDKLYKTLKDTPKVATVNIKTAALDNFKKVLDENLLQMQLFNAVFASIIAFGVVYNAARITLAERSHELATLRVIGFTRTEISVILLGELGVLTLAALPLGLVLGYGFSAFACWMMQSEIQRLPFVVGANTFAFAAGVVLVASVLSGLAVRRKLDHLDLVSVLKAKE